MYTGLVTLYTKLPFVTNDLFNLSMVQYQKGYVDQLIVLPVKDCCGFGRFINGKKDEEDKVNCEPLTIFYRNEDGKWEPIIIIVTKNTI